MSAIPNLDWARSTPAAVAAKLLILRWRVSSTTETSATRNELTRRVHGLDGALDRGSQKRSISRSPRHVVVSPLQSAQQPALHVRTKQNSKCLRACRTRFPSEVAATIEAMPPPARHQGKHSRSTTVHPSPRVGGIFRFDRSRQQRLGHLEAGTSRPNHAQRHVSTTAHPRVSRPGLPIAKTSSREILQRDLPHRCDARQ